MTVPFFDLRREVAALRAELDAAIARTLDGGEVVLGEAVAAFERAFADYCGAAHAVGVASGTDALELALRALDVGPGDEVVAPANTCVPTVAAIESAGARPVLVDVDPRTRTLAPDRVADAVGPATRAIVAVHLYGRCADVGALARLAEERGLALVEDAAQAHGAEAAGARAGALGRIAAFSFYPTKNLGALGDGGAVVTSDDALAERVRRLRVYGERARYDSVEPGRNSRLDELQAAILLAKLPRLEAWLARRAELAALYDELLADVAVEVPERPARGRHAFHLYVIRVARRDEVRARLEAAGVGAAVHYPRAVHEHEAYARLGEGGRLGESEALAREVLSLPLFPTLTDGEVERVADAVRAAAGPA